MSALTREYADNHFRVVSFRGRASSHLCLGYSSRCLGRARDWATLHGHDGHDPYADYVPLCRLCHSHYDDVGSQLRRRWSTSVARCGKPTNANRPCREPTPCRYHPDRIGSRPSYTVFAAAGEDNALW